MKTRYILGVLAVLIIALAAPAMAYDKDVKVVSQNGGIQPVFSMSITDGTPTINLAIGTNELTTGTPEITVTTNSQWAVTAKDNMKWGKPAGTEGKMVETSTTILSRALTNPFEVGTNGNAYVSMTASPQTIMSGGPGTTIHPMKFKQVVVAEDSTLPGTNYYGIELTVSGGSV